MEEFLEEGRENGYISMEISKEAILLFLEIIRVAFSNNQIASKKIGSNPLLFKEIYTLILYGIYGKND